MKIRIQFKTTAPPLLITLVLLCLGFSPKAQAVIPAPDGGYPGANTAEGQNALLSRTTGGYNTAVGILALRSVTTGSFNTGLGAGALLSNTANENTATGVGALLSNTTASENTANGAFALVSNSTGGANTAIGDRALQNNTTGSDNTANGHVALFSNTTGTNNTANGSQALYNNIIGNDNTATGFGALYFNIGDDNTATGFQALNSNTIGVHNTANGVQALYFNQVGGSNTAIGWQALHNNTGQANTANGSQALYNSTTGAANTALGSGAGNGVSTASNVICIGAIGGDVSNSCYIGQIFGGTSANGVPVLINQFDKLGTTTSSKRFKEDIKPMDKTSEALFALKPVSFRYKKDIDPAGISQFGLVAEDVEKVNPDLIVRDKEGRAYSVRYDQVNAMLLNEFLKEHRKAEQQETTIARLESTVAKQQKEMETVIARLEEQDSKIQRVSDQLEASKPVARMVLNSP